MASLTSLAIAESGGGSGALVSTTNAFESKVIDGYVKSARVCLGLNENLKCDDDPGDEEEVNTILSGDGGIVRNFAPTPITVFGDHLPCDPVEL